MRWITCLSSFYIRASFPRSCKWQQSAVAFESTGMLNIPLPDGQQHAQVWQRAPLPHTHTLLQLLADKMIVVFPGHR